MKIYHNPRCRKSRETLALIREKNVEPDIILYLDTPPTKAELRELLRKLDMKASDLVRKGEQIYKDNFKGQQLSEEEWLDVLVNNPRLIERPIVVAGKRAVLGRPPEQVLELLD